MDTLPIEIYPLFLHYLKDDLSSFALINKRCYNIFKNNKDSFASEIIRYYIKFSGSIDYETYRLILYNYQFLLDPINLEDNLMEILENEFDESEYEDEASEFVSVYYMLYWITFQRGDILIIKFLHNIMSINNSRISDNIKNTCIDNIPYRYLRVSKYPLYIDFYLSLPDINKYELLDRYTDKLHTLVEYSTSFEYLFNLFIVNKIDIGDIFEDIVIYALRNDFEEIMEPILNTLVKNHLYPTNDDDYYTRITKIIVYSEDISKLKSFIRMIKNYKIDLIYIILGILLETDNKGTTDMLDFAFYLMNSLELLKDKHSISLICDYAEFMKHVDVLDCYIKNIRKYMHPAWHMLIFNKIYDNLLNVDKFSSKNYIKPILTKLSKYIKK